ncbi:mitochondrial carrier [Annulohypoxylon truncatum]|uniref:mitochondrial carrier n=1 Tax=Annulohypoxylon truncatum TaxID=327061 RepID=UPI002007B451|nr:mitochondrial carrier [Annulohypoxylon truncatum]KAI1210516.1 mitochondrial carrier [Annulohypoxylon truncatum]
MTPQPPQPPFATALLAGGIAGTTVDLSLFPLDTLKTRLQSHAGFFPSGGFRGIYRGVGSALVGSAPGAAFFFCTYEGVKGVLASRRLRREAREEAARGKAGGLKLDPIHGDVSGNGIIRGLGSWEAPLEHMLAASLGEVAACAVRVPTEVVKQRAQAGLHGGSSAAALTAILTQFPSIGLAGVWRELYRGWGITVMREVPFTVIQFPLWEALKGWGRRRKNGGVTSSSSAGNAVEVSAGESALYGSVSGAVAAGITTPLDVLKTRVMLSKEREKVFTVLTDLLRNHGIRPFFAGIGPRVMWISAGGAIFLGSYQWAVNALQGNII